MVTITQSQYNTAKQTSRNKYIRVDLLNFDYLIVEQLEGNVIEGNVSINANSDIRRTCDITMIVDNTSFDLQAGGKIWLDKLIRIYVGIDDIRLGEICWTNMGIFLINSPDYQYDAQTNILKFEGVDLTAKMTGARNGYLTGVTYQVPQGSRVKEVITTCLNYNGFTRYVVNDCINTDGSIQSVPMDYDFDQGSTWWDIITKMRDILPNYQTYFDVEGVFHYEPIPYSADDPIVITDDLWKENVISENIKVDFSSVKNDIEIWGATHDLEFFGDSSQTTVTDNAIATDISNVNVLRNGMIVGFKLPSSANGNLTLNVSSTGAYPILDENNNYVDYLGYNEIWCVYYENGAWKFLGHRQAQAKIVDNNPDSPFYVGGSVGHIKITLFGGEYEDIQSDYLAMQRAKFELYTRCRLNDTLSITCVPVYWIDVNIKVSYTPLGGNETNQYIINSVSIPLGETSAMDISLSRFYPYYPAI